ncbi:unnamed protein product [Rotaria sordida]|uniref:Uncharacterized protein n=1 Tax=Rotaria sordida TaxID=392033 RepID=A0A819AFS9_9BILA|nr:unnamed protein product [Rotaria sordida]
MPQKSLWPFTDQYLDGNVWKEMFEQYLPCLSKFEFYMVVLKRLPKLDLNFVVESFNYFVNKYSNWDMIIDRWKYDFRVEINFRRTIDDNKNASQNLTYLSCFVHLWNVKKLEFRSSFHADRWKDVQLILQACPNVDSLIINTPLLVLSKLIDNSFLIPIFKQIKMIKSITEDIYFPSAFVSKFVQRFPSLCHIELQVFSFDNCSFIIDIFLTELKQISYLKINYDDTYFDDPFSCEYIIIKRRQAFPLDIINEQMVNVKNNGEVIEIWLS